MKEENKLSVESERAYSYKLLAECYYLPDEKQINLIYESGKPIKEFYSGILTLSARLPDGQGDEETKGLPDNNELEQLKIDYSKLFVGPFKLLASPYGSTYLEGSEVLMGDSTMDVKNFYGQEGLFLNIKEAPDHIAIELEFMCFLIFKEIEAIKTPDQEKENYYLIKQLSFLETHIGRWIPEFTDKVIANAQTEFYKNLARTTKVFIEKDLKRLIDYITEHNNFAQENCTC